MVEVSTIDSTIALDGHVTADTTPKSHTFKAGNENLLTIDFTLIDLLAFNILFLFHYLLILGLSLRAVQAADIKRIENLLLHVKGHVSVLHRLQSLIDECQQESHDDHENRTIYNNISVAVSIQFHLVPPLFKRFEMLRATTKWSIVGANILPKKIASIIPSG